MDLTRLRRPVLAWFAKHRRDLPWRKNRDPYKILVSEVMLQQTQVDRVIPKYREFLRVFRSCRRLADARLGAVLRTWSGLGYNGRALRLWEAARAVCRDFKGALPRDISTLSRLPGIGRYTACAVASIAFGAPVPAVDTNARRVLSRSVGGRDRLPEKALQKIASAALPPSRAGEWNQALMDIGAVYCRATPRCELCPLRRMCRWARRVGRGEPRSPRLRPSVVRRIKARATVARYLGSRRYYRGRIVRALTRAPSLNFLALGAEVKPDFQESDLAWLAELLFALQREGLIVLDESQNRARLP